MAKTDFRRLTCQTGIIREALQETFISNVEDLMTECTWKFSTLRMVLRRKICAMSRLRLFGKKPTMTGFSWSHKASQGISPSQNALKGFRIMSSFLQYCAFL